MRTWTVRNTVTEECMEGLTDVGFYEAMSRVPSAEFDLWVACRSDLPQWFACSKFPVFSLRRFGLGSIPLDLGLNARQLEWLISELDRRGEVSEPSPAMVSQASRPQVRRRLQVVLISGDQAFRSCTHEISSEGLTLEREIPGLWHGRDCTAYLSEVGSPRKYAFRTRVLAGAPSYRVGLESAESMEGSSRLALEKWMATPSS
jgi:hypothetical protein